MVSFPQDLIEVQGSNEYWTPVDQKKHIGWIDWNQYCCTWLKCKPCCGFTVCDLSIDAAQGYCN